MDSRAAFHRAVGQTIVRHLFDQDFVERFCPTFFVRRVDELLRSDSGPQSFPRMSLIVVRLAIEGYPADP